MMEKAALGQFSRLTNVLDPRRRVTLGANDRRRRVQQRGLRFVLPIGHAMTPTSASTIPTGRYHVNSTALGQRAGTPATDAHCILGADVLSEQCVTGTMITPRRVRRRLIKSFPMTASARAGLRKCDWCGVRSRPTP